MSLSDWNEDEVTPIVRHVRHRDQRHMLEAMVLMEGRIATLERRSLRLMDYLSRLTGWLKRAKA